VGRKRKWANDAVKQQAYHIRCEHPDWTDEQISKQLVIGLDATPTELKKQSLIQTDTKSTINKASKPNDLSTESEGMPKDFIEKVRMIQYAQQMGVEVKLNELCTWEKAHKDDEIKLAIKPIIYTRPTAFHSKQHQIVDGILNPKIKLIFIEGCQRSGKSTSVFAGLHELTLFSNHPLRVALLAGKGGKNSRDGGSKRILSDILKDPILETANNTVIDFLSRTTESIKWKNGSQMVAMDLTVASIKGGDNEIVWIDELDVAIAEGDDKRQAVVSAVNSMLATTDFKLILSSNLDKGIYQILRDAINALNTECVMSISIQKADCPHLLRNEVSMNYMVGRTVSDALCGEGFGKMRLDGEMTSEGDTFDFASITDAFDQYESFMAINKQTGKRIAFLDPSGTGHPFGFFIFEYNPTTDELWEVFSKQWRMGTGDGETWSPDRIFEFIYMKCKEFSVKLFGTEGNSGGQFLALKLKQKGIPIIIKTWEGTGTNNSQEMYVKLFRHFLDERKVYLQNPLLKTQLTIYTPKKSNEQFKGDLADAAINALWWAVGGIQYLKKLQNMVAVCHAK
jgi:hypothetical protein